MAALDAPSTILVPVWRDKNFVRLGSEPRATLPTVAEASELIDAAGELVWLGKLGERDCFALDLSDLAEPMTHPALVGLGEPSDLRLSGGLLSPEEAEVLAYARGMMNWHRRHRFCGSCGLPTRPKEGGHVRECEAEDLKHFPRTDPAIMVLVTHGDRCVLARQHGWPQGMMAAIAGFVEPGESIEDAARREVGEELGLEVEDLRYFRSQPWPFPSSLMLGFAARATTTEIVRDESELEDAQWFSKTELRNPRGFFIPPPYSLAHHLIAAFLDADDPDGT